MDSVYKLKGVVQNYSWGGKKFIPELLQVPNTDAKPFAEYWLGAHPNAPSFLENGQQLSLQEAIKRNGEQILGKRVMNKFGSLPYLFKILDVSQMLSIQVHPSKESAVDEYKKEEEKGIPVTAPNRNYKDQNHKPELMVALSDFWLLHGFKEEEALKTIFKTVPELSYLESVFNNGGYKALYEDIMRMAQEKVDKVLEPLVQKIIPKYDSNELQKSDENFWAARAVKTFCKDNHYDRGIFSIYLFNLLYLKEGDAIYQPAGLPHAYLEGQNVEVMANSDNVLRAGLTDKHVDVAELMKHVTFEATYPAILKVSNESEQAFAAPVEEFFLKKYKTEKRLTVIPESATILFVYNGEAEIVAGSKTIHLGAGEAALLLPGNDVSVQPLRSSITIFAVSTPE